MMQIMSKVSHSQQLDLKSRDMKNYVWMLLLLGAVFYSCTDDGMLDEDEIYSNVERVDVEYLFDNVTYTLTDKITGDVDQISGVEHNAEFTSIAGVSENIGKTFTCNFEGNEVLGKTLKGYLDVVFDNANNRLSIDVGQTREFTSFVVGNVFQDFEIIANSIGLDKTYDDPDTGKEVREYLTTGDNACNKTTLLKYKEVNDQYTDELFTYSCNSRAYIKVTVYYE